MRLIAKTLFGLEEILKDELNSLGAQNTDLSNRAVIFEGDKSLLYKANYTLRTALSVLMQIADFRINTVKDLYNRSLKVEWGRYLNPDLTFSIVPVVHSSLFRHSGYPGLIVKDAIADWFRKSAGRRPSVNTDDPDIVFNLHIRNS
jgi:putative N6-adenine-specific DNA methylase